MIYIYPTLPPVYRSNHATMFFWLPGLPMVIR